MSITRTFIPGSEWLYYKLYTGMKSADTLLIKILYPYVQSLEEQGLIRRFFFIRYADPHFHLRFRLHLSNEKQFTEVLNRFYSVLQPCIENGLVWNIQIDTYKREIERYGEHTMDIAETIFGIDSKSIIKLLSLLGHPEGDIHRGLLALALLDDTLSAVNYDIVQKKNILQTISESFKREFNFTTHTYKQPLSLKFREQKKTVFEVLNYRNESIINTYSNYLTDRKAMLQAYMEQLLSANQENTPHISTDALLNSLMHMTMNRLFRSKNRLHELVVYDFLYRYYESSLARSKNS